MRAFDRSVVAQAPGQTTATHRIGSLNSVLKDSEAVSIYYEEPSIPIPVESEFNTEQYDNQTENEFLKVTENPLSTFSIDVDTASYANIRRLLNNQQTVPAGAVRIEEMVNYFTYNYPQPTGEDPFSINIEVAKAPWNTDHLLAKIGLQGKSLTAQTLPESNLVFLIDVSGSMQDANKLPLLKTGFKLMVQQLRSEEKVSIVTYAGNAGVLLDSVSGGNKQQIISAIDQLSAGGSTAGAQGILTAYELAAKNYIKGGNNRVILATDGDFNIGVSNDSELVKMIEEKRKQGIFLTVLGFGMGNYKDSRMEKLADKGNGNYYYIDTEREAKKVLVRELGSTLFTIAKDVKLQIEFNPAQVKAYRLIGYENRMLAKEDFNDDTKDAGELGAGHTVTAFYEIVPASSSEDIGGSVDALKYQVPQAKPDTGHSDEVMTVKFRYKNPDEDVSKLISQTVTASQISENPSEDFQFASAVAEFGMLLKNSKHKGNATFEAALKRARSAQGKDEWGYRAEFIDLVQKGQTLVPETYSTGYGFKNAE
ncbi:MAG TPA: VWA domain-containing protein [Candidatus Omnitrophota bacterium]|nr:VWA domain-containing protein [Candidatus Omnitrophota bacterium]